MSAGNMKTRVKKLINEQNFRKAQELCKKLCAKSPRDPEALFLCGGVYGQLGDYAVAERLFREALVLAPDHPLLNYNLGVVLFQQNRFEEAMEPLSRTVQLDGNQFEAWMFLGHACEAAGAHEHAIKSYGQAVTLQPSSEEALHALGGLYLRLEMWPSASDIYTRLLGLNPEKPDYINNLGISLSRAYQFERLISLLKPVAISHPREITPNFFVGMAHLELGEVEDALVFYKRILETDPNHIESIVGMASVHYFRGQHEEALKIIEPLTRTSPEIPGVALVFAAIAPRFKLFEEAAKLLEWQLASPKLTGFLKGKMSVALGNLYDKSGDYEKAFRYIRQGNDLCAPEFNRANHLKSIEILEELYTEDSIAHMPVSGSDSNQPIFIVGMPRSGTTLVEQILASHSQVFGAGELKYIQNYCFELHDMQINGKVYPLCLADVSPEVLLRLSKDYQGQLDRLSGGLAPRVTDKIPSNHLHLGLIYQLFPKAKVIHIKRDPMDTCVSCFCQFFSGAYPYTYNLDDLGFYYRSYERLMKFWKKVLPLDILELSYEELVQDQENMTRKILDFCELPWEQECMDFHKTNRVVATASTDQVREPIYRSAIGKWRRFESHVGALAEALEKY